ncbi:DUF3152 domain-containing protein [Cellulosimicrobium terreum]|nr:DUF3152 domain-containing protein [Cellulosimicrobium terreum]
MVVETPETSGPRPEIVADAAGPVADDALVPARAAASRPEAVSRSVSPPRLVVDPQVGDGVPGSAPDPGPAGPTGTAGADVPPAPQPAPDPTPSPVAAPSEPVEPEEGSGLLGTDVVADLGGELVVVAGEADPPADAPAGAEPRTVRVEVEDGLPVDGEVFADAVITTLNDPRGWSSSDGVTFARTDGDEPSIRVVLASPTTVDDLCAPLQTEGTYSCGNSVDGVAVLNFERWVLGAPDFADDVATYRQYLVNHEVGHVLGHAHEPCPAKGEVAPVMVQQSISTEGCLPNGWPSP